MERSPDGFGSTPVEVYKNFHDEREWRYVPSSDVLSTLNIHSIIASPKIISIKNEISNELVNERYKALWLDFSHDDIRYIIVPDNNERLDFINIIIIMDLPEDYILSILIR